MCIFHKWAKDNVTVRLLAHFYQLYVFLAFRLKSNLSPYKNYIIWAYKTSNLMKVKKEITSVKGPT